jgi:putative colanic acid biosynthesis acetyltransferase WcaF
MNLDTFDNEGFDRGASRVKEAAWLAISSLLFSSSLPGSAWRVGLLKAFGAEVGRRVVIKPSVRIKFPWRLRIGDHCWIGEGAWIDNLDLVSLGSDVCVSQGVYICTGSHDWGRSSFNLVTKPVHVCSKAWLGAFSRVAPGTCIDEGAVLAFGSVAKQTLSAWCVYAGNPAVRVRARPRQDDSSC